VRVAGPPFQEWCEAWSRECLRVLKPGGHMLAFGGTRTWHRLACAVEDAGFEVRDSIAWLYGSGFPKSLNLVDEDGERTGWGTALKPAFEPVVVARKPLVGTVAANVLTHGTGALNIEACRVGTQATTRTKRGGANDFPHEDDSWTPRDVQVGSDAGRWPANVVLDETQAEALDEQSGELHSQDPRTRQSNSTVQGVTGFTTQPGTVNYGDTGGASRFYYVAKADASERVRVNGTAHPTVKPLALMRWLVRLVTPPGGTVLEPFAGSGTTVEACIVERFNVIAIERADEYLPLIESRIARRRDPVKAITLAGEDLGLFGEASA
jgi:site-specific DNA-methyltransferase (adenine-specific)